MPSESKYTVERRGAKYYLYNPDGTKTEGQEAFTWERSKVARLYARAAELNYKAEHV